MSRAALIIFQKNAILGKVKTRLAASIGDERALEIYDWLTDYTHRISKEVQVDKFIFYSDFIPEFTDQLPEEFNLEVQSGDSLGERMKNAFNQLGSRGYTSIVIIGTDCPDLQTSDLNTAFLTLSQADLVIGPAQDGGYYLLGMSRFFPELFDEMPWSTHKVLELTLNKADSLNLDYEFLNILSDIDTIKDWEAFNLRSKPVLDLDSKESNFNKNGF